MGMDPAEVERRRKAKAVRFARIAGQVGGIAKMVEDGRYCVDIVHQIKAVRAALDTAEAEILRDHAATCVADAIASGDPEQQRAKVDELVDLLTRAKR